MGELNLLDRYPRAVRPIEERGSRITEDHRRVARRFGKEYFDGDRLTGYGGYSYHPRFWKDTVARFVEEYGLTNESSLLDVGCAKGFMLYEFKRLLPGLTIAGVDVSDYGIERSHETIRPYLHRANAKGLPFSDGEFDLVISINAIHNLELEECKQALREIQRVTKQHAFVTVDAWRTDLEKQQLLKWNLTALTYMHTTQWESVFAETGYAGDYYWFIANSAA